MKKPSTSAAHQSRLILEELEERRLFSGGIEGLIDSGPGETPEALYVDAEPNRQKTAEGEGATTAAEQRRQEVAFVDAGVENYQQLIDDLQQNADDGRSIEVVLLDRDRDGIEQVSEILLGYDNLDAIHLISHGEDGSVQLGNSSLDADSLQQNNLQIALWANSFAETGDILIYGCNLAGSEIGQSLISDLASLTLTDVAASDDLTGHESRGGDWVLEFNVGTIEARVAVSDSIQESWQSTLAVGVDNTTSGTDVNTDNLTVSHTTSGTDRLVLVSVVTEPNGGESVSSMTYGGVAMSNVGSYLHSSSQLRVELWASVGEPATGSHDVVINLSAQSKSIAASVTSLTGVDQGSPLGAFVTAEGNSTAASVNVASASEDLVFGVAAVRKGIDATPTGGASEIFDTSIANIEGAGSINNGAPSVSTSWTLDVADQWIASGISISSADSASGSDGTAIWRDASTTPQTSDWNGGSFAPATATAPAGDYRIMQGAEAPTRDEIIIVGVDESSQITGEIWNGSSWSVLPGSLGSPLGTVSQNYWWGMDVQYESQSGDALVVWTDGGNLEYATWDGSSWSGVNTISFSGSTPRQLQLAASPDSDEMLLVVSDSSSEDFALVWDGSSWGNELILEQVGGDDRTDINVIYEHQSGHAMVVYGKTDIDAYYRIWNGSSWEPEGSVSQAVGASGDVRWTTLASNPNSDQIALGVITSNGDTWLNVWNGNGWGTSELATTSSTGTNHPAVAVAFESSSGDLLAAYGESGSSSVKYQTWTSGGGWSGEQIGPDIGGTPNSLMLAADPISDQIMLTAQDANSHVNYVLWNGSGWGAPTELGTGTTETKNQPFLFLWDQGPGNLAPTAIDDAYSVGENSILTSNDSWFDGNWQYSRTLSFDNSARTENLIDFPILVKLDSSVIDYAKTHDQGWDVRFFDQDGTPLAHEIEHWDEAGTSYVWVKIPQIDASSSTDSIVMYYGNAGVAGSGEDPAGVWSDYRATYHLNENPGATGTVSDSAGNFDAVNSSSTDTAGMIGNAQDFNGVDQHIDLGDDRAWINNASGATLSIWMNADTTSGSGDLIGLTRNDPADTGASRITLIRNGDDIQMIARTMDDSSDSVSVSTTTNPLAAGSWHHITGTVDYSSDINNINIYVDGQLEGTFSHNFTLDAIPNTDSSHATIGSDEDGVDSPFDGQLDEARISDQVRSADWISAQYAAMTGNLVSVGFEQTVQGVLINDVDADRDALTVTELNGVSAAIGTPTALPSGAIVTLNADGSFTYDTNNAFESLGAGDSTNDSFTYLVDDGNGGTDSTTVTITVNGVDDAATITGDTSYSGNEGDAVAGDLNATDVEGLTDGTYFSVSAPAANGTAAINASTGAWTFTPTDPNWFGSDSFEVTVTDDRGGTTTQIVNVTLTNVDDPATIGGNTSGSANEGVTVTGTLTATDVDGLTDGDYFSITGTLPTNGTAAINASTGAWTFTPTDPNWFGSDSFEVTVTDDQGGTTTQIINVTLTNVDDPAVIGGNTSGSANEGVTVTGTLTATDADGLTDGTYFSITGTLPTNGTAAINASTGAWTFTPTDPDWFGSDSFEVTVTDDEGGTTTQIVNVTLTNVDDPAVIGGNTSGSANEGVTVTGTLTATDADGLTDGDYFSITGTPPTNGTAAINASTGAWTFTPTDPNWFGSDSFEVTVTDDQGGTTTQIINVTLTNVDDPATIGGNTSGSANEGVTVTGTLTASDADGLTDGDYFSITGTPPTNGTAAINASTGAWTFTPTDPNWFGSDSFEVTVTDDQGGTTTQIINVTLTNVDDPATIGGNTSGSANEGVTVAGTLTATDADGLTDGTYFSITGTLPTNGTAAINASTGAWTFTPTDPDWFGSDSFEVTVTDDQGGTTTQIVNVTLTNVDDPAVIGGNTSGSANEGVTVTGTLTATDADGLTDGDYFSITGTLPTNGTAAINASTGAWTFTPTDPNWFGSDSFEVTVTDDEGGTTTQIVNVTLTNVDDPAVIGGDISYSGNEGDVVSGTMTASDPDGLTDGTYFSVSTPAANGTAAIDPATGAWTFTPTIPSWTGSDSFTVTVTDDLGGTTTQLISITLVPVNNLPTIGGDDSGSVTEDQVDSANNLVRSGALTIVDPDVGESSFVASTINGAFGTLVVDAAGNWTYSASNDQAEIQALRAGESITDTLTVTTADGTTHDVVITIEGVDDAAPPPPVTPPDDEPPPEEEPPADEEANSEPVGEAVAPTPPPIDATPQETALPQPEVNNDTSTDEPRLETVAVANEPDVREVTPKPVAKPTLNLEKLALQVSEDPLLNEQFEQALLDRIDAMHRGMDGDDAGRSADDIEVQIIMGSTAGLTAGIVSWVLRGGSLLASLMSTVPLLNRFDPLPILKTREDKENVADDDADDPTDTRIGEHAKKVDNLFSGADEKRE